MIEIQFGNVPFTFVLFQLWTILRANGSLCLCVETMSWNDVKRFQWIIWIMENLWLFAVNNNRFSMKWFRVRRFAKILPAVDLFLTIENNLITDDAANLVTRCFLPLKTINFYLKPFIDTKRMENQQLNQSQFWLLIRVTSCYEKILPKNWVRDRTWNWLTMEIIDVSFRSYDWNDQMNRMLWYCEVSEDITTQIKLKKKKYFRMIPETFLIYCERRTAIWFN